MNLFYQNRIGYLNKWLLISTLIYSVLIIDVQAQANKDTSQPFFIYYPMNLPHDPFVPTPDSPEWQEPSKRYDEDPIYFKDMISYIDKIVERLVEKLEE